MHGKTFAWSFENTYNSGRLGVFGLWLQWYYWFSIQLLLVLTKVTLNSWMVTARWSHGITRLTFSGSFHRNIGSSSILWRFQKSRVYIRRVGSERSMGMYIVHTEHCSSTYNGLAPLSMKGMIVWKAVTGIPKWNNAPLIIGNICVWA
jgi:hypothetical protein